MKRWKSQQFFDRAGCRRLLEPLPTALRIHEGMDRCYNWSWVESRVSAAAAEWSSCDGKAWDAGRRFCPQEQQKREDAYDEALEKVEREVKYARRGGKQRAEAQGRVVAVFPRF